MWYLGKQFGLLCAMAMPAAVTRHVDIISRHGPGRCGNFDGLQIITTRIKIRRNMYCVKISRSSIVVVDASVMGSNVLRLNHPGQEVRSLAVLDCCVSFGTGVFQLAALAGVIVITEVHSK